MSTGLATEASADRKPAKPVLQLIAELDNLESICLESVDRKNPGPTGIGEDADPAPCRKRLIGQQRRHVKQLGERVRPDHPGLPEQRVHGSVEAGERTRMTGGRPGTGSSSPGLDGNDGFLLGDSPSCPGKPTRVTERLHVQQDYVRRRDRTPSRAEDRHRKHQVGCRC